VLPSLVNKDDYYVQANMTNEVLRDVFQEEHSKTVTKFSPDSVTDVLFEKKVISADEYDRLRHVPAPTDRCRDLLSLLHNSSHPQTFVRLRLALLHEHPWIVDEIDKILTSRLQQLHLDHTQDGKLLLINLYVNLRTRN